MDKLTCRAGCCSKGCIKDLRAKCRCTEVRGCAPTLHGMKQTVVAFTFTFFAPIRLLLQVVVGLPSVGEPAKARASANQHPP